MTTTYLCKKCNLKTCHYNDLKKHLLNKKKCSKNLEAFRYSDDQLLIMTLLPYYEDKHILDDNEIINLNKSNNLHTNKVELLKVLDNIEITKTKKCIFCNEEFSKQLELRKHILMSCFYKELKKKEGYSKTAEFINEGNIDGNDNIFANQSTIINTNHSNNTTNNITNNNITNIYLNVKTPIPFDDDWDLSQIDIDKQTNLLFSKIMYSTLLEEILKNDTNLNVIIDKDNDSGMVYKNDIDKYIKMKLNDIVKSSMDKLKKHLLDINEKSKDHYLEECLLASKKIIENKYRDYKLVTTIQQIVNFVIPNVYDKKKNEAINISVNLEKDLKEDLKTGY